MCNLHPELPLTCGATLTTHMKLTLLCSSGDGGGGSSACREQRRHGTSRSNGGSPRWCAIRRRTFARLEPRGQAPGRWTRGGWWGPPRKPTLHGPTEHLAIRAARPAEHMRRHVRASMHGGRPAMLHGVEPWSRRSHHPRVEPRLPHGMESHPRPRRGPSRKHHAVHWLMPVELGRHSLPRYRWLLPLCGSLRFRCLRGCCCCGGGSTIASVGSGDTSLLCRPLGPGFSWDAIYAVDLQVHALPPFLRIWDSGNGTNCSCFKEVRVATEAVQRATLHTPRETFPSLSSNICTAVPGPFTSH